MNDLDDKLRVYFVDLTKNNSIKFNNNNIDDHKANINMNGVAN